ncbi:MAG TPA: hypothetical protein VF362_01565, partial [Demequinaceae bacterium]
GGAVAVSFSDVKGDLFSTKPGTVLAGLSFILPMVQNGGYTPSEVVASTIILTIDGITTIPFTWTP